MPFEHDDIPAGPGQPVVFATTIEGPPEKIERALGLLRGQILSLYKGQPGWRGTFGLVSFDRRRSLVLNFWESASALNEHLGDMARLRERASGLGVTISNSDRFEIQFEEQVE
jgi:hypothetical protein